MDKGREVFRQADAFLQIAASAKNPLIPQTKESKEVSSNLIVVTCSAIYSKGCSCHLNSLPANADRDILLPFPNAFLHLGSIHALDIFLHSFT